MGLLQKLTKQQGRVEDDEINSIIANLQNILNTTRDYGYFLHNFGISDFRYLGTRDDINKAIINEITENIQLFEPRVVLRQIEGIANDKLNRLAFRIDCQVISNASTLQLFLQPVQAHYQICT